MRARFWLGAIVLGACVLGDQARAESIFFFSTGNPDGRMAMASRLLSDGTTQIEAADDFVTTAASTKITSATFSGGSSGIPGW